MILNGELLPWSSIEAGLPKGSILGPFSFFIYINDISDDLITNFRLYTDDFLLFSVADGINLLASNLNSDLTSTNVEIFWLLVLILLPYLKNVNVKCQGHTQFQSQIIELEPLAPLKNLFFQMKSLKNQG